MQQVTGLAIEDFNYHNRYQHACVLQVICEENLKVFRDGIEDQVDKFLKHTKMKLLLCLDEIQALSNCLTNLFLPCQVHNGKNVEDVSNNLNRRGLLYAAQRSLHGFTVKEKWGVYMTGTSFTLSYVKSENSPARMNVENVDGLDIPIKVDDMTMMIDKYWSIDSDVLVAIRENLKRFEGRPLFFIDSVLVPLTVFMKSKLSIIAKDSNTFLDTCYAC